MVRAFLRSSTSEGLLIKIEPLLPKEVEAKVEKTVEAKTDYSKLTVAELKAACAEKGIEVTTSMKKADLVAALNK